MGIRCFSSKTGISPFFDLMIMEENPFLAFSDMGTGFIAVAVFSPSTTIVVIDLLLTLNCIVLSITVILY